MNVPENCTGLSEEDEQLIMENAHILIHSAATIRFDEHIRLVLTLYSINFTIIFHRNILYFVKVVL